MRAVLCKAYGSIDDLVMEEVPSPPLQPDQVRVRVAAAGVNFPDVLIVEGKYQAKPELPFAPGSEASGTIVEVGAEVEDYAPGDAVIVTTLWGCFAEEVVIPATRVMRRPDTMDAVTAAGFAITYGTSYHALVQRAAVQLGKVLGARVIAAASTEAKLALARANGADDGINYSLDGYRDRIKELTGGRGVDVVYDPVGGALFEPSLRSMAWGGRYLVVGFASGEIPKVPANLTLLKGCSVVGVFWGHFHRNEGAVDAENFRHLFALHAEGKIKPLISATYPLEQARDALAALTARTVTGKVVLSV
ncbi:MAG: NADPH:quinone oxidoreductase family protein [Alphaproteobacteria bacterium]|nr:NADPH:quinone oxidoreductase family protein [Alphaproteobacteria bacterium]